MSCSPIRYPPHTDDGVCVCVCLSIYCLFIMLDCVSPILVLTFIFLFRNQLLILLSSVHFAEIRYAAAYRSLTVYGLSNVTE